MKKLKVLFISLVVVVVALLVGAYFLPAEYRVERSVVINAKPKAVYPWVNTLNKWPLWTVWTTNLDSTMKFEFSGPAEGPSATYVWKGEKVGNGKLVITRSEQDKGVWYSLDFEEGKYVSAGGLTFQPVGETTRVIWHNGGQLGYNPANRYFGLLMDRMMGPDFAKGLENLKRIIEARK